MNIFFEQLLAQKHWYFLLILSYFLGSIPFAYLITKIFSNKNILKVGSQNAGSTNVTRVAGKKAGIITFVLDFSKSLLALFIINNLTNSSVFWLSLCSFLVLLGHTKSIFLGFRGGKGVACNFAIWAYLSFFSSLSMFAVWFVFYRWKKIVSLSSIVGCFLLPLIVWFFEKKYFLIAVVSAIYILLLHTQNIIRLIRGEESPFTK